ncbi:MAG: flagellar motor stator protein MotA [Nitrospiraceae bacterium]|nr:flagellar motor stator protein MotA [Nitrospiraceae bacterium]MDA8090894.1 flagellar motor stator protein MotA [Nitrospiraceae bacterium]
MLIIIGAVVVMLSVGGGFLMEHGNPSILWDPAELIIICGAAFGSFLLASPAKLLSEVVKNVRGSVGGGRKQSKRRQLDLLVLLYRLFHKVRKEGLVSIESDIEKPENSSMFKTYYKGQANQDVIDFICDNLKVIITTNVPAHELETLMELEIETRQHEAMGPSRGLAKLADALPGFGIVAAVLGVVLTMGQIDQPPAILGRDIGSALTGTFLGVLLSYGFVGPLATNLEHMAQSEEIDFQVIKVAIVAFVGGAAPQIAVEFGRRAIPGDDCPSFNELEKEVRGK